MSLHIRDKTAVSLVAEAIYYPTNPSSILETFEARVQVGIDVCSAIFVRREENQATTSVGFARLALFDNDVFLPPIAERCRAWSYRPIGKRSKKPRFLTTGNPHCYEPMMRREIVGVIRMRAIKHRLLPLAKLSENRMGLSGFVEKHAKRNGHSLGFAYVAGIKGGSRRFQEL